MALCGFSVQCSPALKMVLQRECWDLMTRVAGSSLAQLQTKQKHAFSAKYSVTSQGRPYSTVAFSYTFPFQAVGDLTSFLTLLPPFFHLEDIYYIGHLVV